MALRCGQRPTLNIRIQRVCWRWLFGDPPRRIAMRRFIIVLSAVLMLTGGLAVALPLAHAQDSSLQDHPLVGNWSIDAEGQGVPTDVVAFHDDGTVTDVETDGTVELGGWEATGPTTANMTIWSSDVDDNGQVTATVVIRVSLEVGSDGNSLTGQYTIEFSDSSGASMGEAGPAPVTGTRLVVEGPGTPVMSMEELFQSF
jgi:hypothetical protein